METASSAPCWSNIVKQQAPPKENQNGQLAATAEKVFDCKSTKGIAVAIVDANAIIQGGEKLTSCADKFVSVSDVINEIRDPASRHSLKFLPYTVDTLEPSPEALKKVISFAKATGDLQTLSDVDLKLIALTYTLESQIHGTKHLRDTPPPIHTVNVKRLPEKDLPGWGSNVPNLKEWEALEQAADDGPSLNPNSRILPLQDLSLNGLISTDQSSTKEDDTISNKESGEDGKTKEYSVKKEVNLEGKTVVDGIDASKGESDDVAGDWLPAVGRSTHRRFLRRKARRENESANLEGSERAEEENENEDFSVILDQMKLEAGEDDDNDDEAVENVEETESEKSVDATSSYGDDNSSEQSWMLRSLSESSVACITGDFAMQNVILQMGLRLVAPGGMQIRELHRWVLKCHACFKVTTEIGKIFCPNCGNGGTLRKVAVTVGENGIVLAARRPRVSLRGTKFSLPLPQGGRDAITKNPILREDQLPQKYLRPKNKKKNKKEGDEDVFTSMDYLFIHHTDKKAPLQPPVRKALAVFSQRRNPNDNHFSRASH
jgi:RNA-binding protein NOB1